MPGSANPVRSYPAAMRVPSPSGIKFIPSSESSKETRQTSGPGPARIQVTVEPPASPVRFCQAADSLENRPMRLRGCPPSVVKPPPTMILPSDWTATSLTPLLAPG